MSYGDAVVWGGLRLANSLPTLSAVTSLWSVLDAATRPASYIINDYNIPVIMATRRCEE